MTQEDKKKEVDKKVREGWSKMVKDSKQICGYNADKWADDLLAHCLSEFLLKKSIDYQYKVAVTDGKLPNYIGRSMSLQVRSSTSMFWHTYRKNMYNTRGTYEADTKENWDDSEYQDVDYHLTPAKDRSAHDCMKYVMDNELDWYEKHIIEKLYFEKWTKKEFMEKYNLPVNSFNKDVKRTINKFKSLCKQFT